MRPKVPLGLGVVLLFVCQALPAGGPQPPAPRGVAKKSHLTWALQLRKGLKLQDTAYQHKPTLVKWAGVDGATRNESRTDCSGLLNVLLKRALGLDDRALAKWLGAARPLAEHYHDAIVKQNKFKDITNIRDVQPGDIIAIKYRKDDLDRPDKQNTGHVLLVVKKPQPHQASAPKVGGTAQWEVAVIDQSTSGHGPTDTRLLPNGTYHSGLGEGVLRLYTQTVGTTAGTIAGHSWSTSPQSTYEPQQWRHLVIGRVQLKP
jgi:hypothetical protein